MLEEDQVVHHAAVGGRSVAWSSAGSGPVLLIGGWWSSHLELDWEDAGFRSFVGRLAERHTVVRYDRPDGWVTFVRQRRVPGVVHQDVEAAQALAEVGLELLASAAATTPVPGALRTGAVARSAGRA